MAPHEGLTALVAKWRKQAGYAEVELSNHERASMFDQCANELWAALSAEPPTPGETGEARLLQELRKRASELDEFPLDAYQDTAALLREAAAVLASRALGEEPQREPDGAEDDTEMVNGEWSSFNIRRLQAAPPLPGDETICRCEPYETCARCRGTERDLRPKAGDEARTQGSAGVPELRRAFIAGWNAHFDDGGPRLTELFQESPNQTHTAGLLADAAEMLWVVLANVSGGDWTKQSDEWQEAAARWRDNYFAVLKASPAPPGAEPSAGEEAQRDV